MGSLNGILGLLAVLLPLGCLGQDGPSKCPKIRTFTVQINVEAFKLLTFSGHFGVPLFRVYDHRPRNLRRRGPELF